MMDVFITESHIICYLLIDVTHLIALSLTRQKAFLGYSKEAANNSFKHEILMYVDCIRQEGTKRKKLKTIKRRKRIFFDERSCIL